jgi:hypothetical protein
VLELLRERARAREDSAEFSIRRCREKSATELNLSDFFVAD